MGNETHLSLLIDFSRRLVRAVESGEIADAVFRTVQELFDLDGCLFFTVSTNEKSADLLAASRKDVEDGISISLTGEESTNAFQHVLRSQQPYRVIATDKESMQPTELASTIPSGSALYVPLAAGGRVLAVCVLYTVGRTQVFRRDDVTLAETIANDAAVALERLQFAQALQAVDERELMITSIARQLRDAQSMKTLLATAREIFLKEFAADRVTIHLAEAGDMPPTVHRRIADARDNQAPGVVVTEDNALSILVSHHRNILGVVEILRPDVALSTAEKLLVDPLASELASAIEHMRLFGQAESRLQEQLALARAAQSLTAELRHDRVMENIVNEAVRVLNTSSATFYTYDRIDQTLTLQAAYGQHEQEVVGLKIPIIGLAGRVVRTGVSQYTNEYEDEIGGVVHESFEDVKRSIAVPVRWQGDLRGIITVAARDNTTPFSSHDVKLLEAFAELVSLALHNAEAYRQQSRQASIQAGFYRIAQVLATSLSRTETLYALAQAAVEALDGDWALVCATSLSATDASFKIESEYAAPERILEQFSAEHFPAPVTSILNHGMEHRSDEDERPEDEINSLAAHAWTYGRVVTSQHVTDDQRLVEGWRNLFSGSGVTSQLAIPIVVADSGESAVVVVCYEEEQRFTDEELVLANNLASAAAAALERAALFENERRTRRLAQVLADMNALLAGTLKTQTVLDRIVEHAVTLLGVDACSLSVVDKPDTQNSANNALTHHATMGSDPELVEALRGAGIGDLEREVMRSKRTFAIEELASETSAQDLGSNAYESYLGVPMLHPRGHLIGVLSVYRRNDHTWDTAETAALESFAHAASSAIRNAELYANLKRDRDTIERLMSSISEGIAATDADGRITLWNEAASAITGIERDEAVGRHWREALGVAKDESISASGEVIKVQTSGSTYWLSLNVTALDPDNANAVILAFRDVSNRQQMVAVQEDFITAVAESLRAPASSIHGFARMMEEMLEVREPATIGTGSDDDGEPADKITPLVEYIAGESSILLTRLKELRDVVELEDGSAQLHYDHIEIHELLSRLPAYLEAGDVDTSQFRVLPGTPDAITIRVDVDRLLGVIARLSGVMQSLNTGVSQEVSLKVTLRGDKVRFAIAGHGVELPVTDQHSFFTRIYRSATQHSSAEGIGLNLYVSKGVVQTLGGAIASERTKSGDGVLVIELPVY